MKVTILGGGFGLYGYLPALLACRLTVILPKRYQSMILAREDLRSYDSCIKWMDNEESILQQVDGIIFAVPPMQQQILIEKYLSYPNIAFYLLEKPLAISPTHANTILELLKASGKKFRMGYYFRYTEWGKNLLSQTKKPKKIIWHFKAHHYANNIKTWKRRHQEGGGALRFYGIHVIALLAEMGYTQVHFSKISTSLEEAETWEAIFSGKNLKDCYVSIATNSNPSRFIIREADAFYQRMQPFQPLLQQEGMKDARIPFIQAGLRDLFEDAESYYSWYQATILLWQQVEDHLI